MNEAPVLLLAYNRPDKLKALIDSLRPHKPSTVLLAVDGPRVTRPSDFQNVALSQQCVELIDWDANVQTRFRETNLGLKAAVIDAVNWSINEFGESIVVEEDCIVGQDFLPFMNHCLRKFKQDQAIAHVSGYNVVPTEFLGSSDIRLTRYPESIAWATWDRAWSNFDETLKWGMNADLRELVEIVGSKIGALKWKLNFADAASDRISTWAYRWIASFWSKGQFAVSPNVNLVNYNGFDQGDHTRTSAPWDEVPIGNLSVDQLHLAGAPTLNKTADLWLSSNVFGENLSGLARGAAVSIVKKFYSEA